MRMLGRKRRERGSITVEATLSLTIFIFFMISIISLINICRVQAKVNNALHLAAIDISHMSYLYYLTGMYDMDVAIQGSAEGSGAVLTGYAENVDSVLNNTETLFELIGNGGQELEGVVSGSSDVSAAIKNLQDIKDSGQTEMEALKANAGLVKEDLQGIAGNPMQFVKTLASFGIGEGYDSAKNLMAGLLAEALIVEHIEASDDSLPYGGVDDADAYLESLGIEDGLDGMSFMASELFGGMNYCDINLVAMYRLNVFPLLGDFATIPVAQSASTRAWLGGDAKTSQELPQASAPEEPQESTQPSEETEESAWDSGALNRNRVLIEQFNEERKSETGSYICAKPPEFIYSGFDEDHNTLYAARTVDPYVKSNMKNGAVSVDKMKIRQNILEKMELPESFVMEGGGRYELPKEDIHFSYTIMIPENVSDEDALLIQAEIDALKAELSQELPEGIASVEIELVKTGGNTASKPAEE